MNDSSLAPANELPIARLSVDVPRVLGEFRKGGDPASNFRLGIREAFQNAIDAVLDHDPEANHTITISVDEETGDVVVRDHGIGMAPEEFESRILRLFGSGKVQGNFGGFGAGTMSILLGAPEVRYRTRKMGGAGGEVSTADLDQRPPRIMSAEEAEAFGHGTEIRFCGVLGQALRYGDTLRKYNIDGTVNDLFGTSNLPANIRIEYCGETVRQTVRLDASTRKLDAESKTHFEGCEVDHHVVPRVGNEIPRHYYQLADPRGRGMSLTQFSVGLDSGCDFHVVTVIRPTVPVEHDQYPFNAKRTEVCVEEVDEAAYRERRRHEIDRQAALKEHTYTRSFYAGRAASEAETRDPVAAAIIDESRSRRNLERKLRLVQHLATAGGIAPEAQEAARQQKEAIERALEDGSYAEALTDDPTMIVTHKDWTPPEFLPQSFDPHNPEHIRPLVPFLITVQQFVEVIRREAANLDPYTYGTDRAEIRAGLNFDPKWDAAQEDVDLPDGRQEPYVLVNPCAERFRRARTPEAMADVLAHLVVHELAHVSPARKAHYDGFIYFADDLHMEIANIRPLLRDIAESMDLWATLRSFHGLPLRAGRVRRGEHGVLARNPSLPVATVELREDCQALVEEMREFAQNAQDRLAGAEAVAEVLAHVEETKMFSEEERAYLRQVGEAIGVRGVRSLEDVLRDGLCPRGEEASRFQVKALGRIGRWYEIRQIHQALDGSYLWEEEIVEAYTSSHLSAAHAATLSEFAQSVRSGWGQYRSAGNAIRSVLDGRPVKTAIREARRDAWDDEEKGMLRGASGEAGVMLGALLRESSDGPPREEFDRYAELRSAVRGFLVGGELPRSVSLREPPKKRATQTSLL